MRKSIVLYTACFATLVFSNCSKAPVFNNEPDEKVSNTQTPIIEAAVSKTLSRFSFSFFDQSQKQTVAGENIFVSPFSLHMALGMVANGITGMIYTAEPIIAKFTCNRPFGIIISENTSRTILFMGRISQPS